MCGELLDNKIILSTNKYNGVLNLGHFVSWIHEHHYSHKFNLQCFLIIDLYDYGIIEKTHVATSRLY